MLRKTLRAPSLFRVERACPSAAVEAISAPMSRPTKLDHGLDAWIATHEGWVRQGTNAIAREFKFKDFGSALAFVVRLGCLAEKKDHHPDVELGWGRVKVLCTTHDAGGITRLDLEMADATNALLT